MIHDQRKLVAVLAADVVGYSRLMGRDESGTLARLREHRSRRLEPTLARYGGRLVKLTGDGALVEFASAVDALSAAIEFQQAMNEVDPECRRNRADRISYRSASRRYDRRGRRSLRRWSEHRRALGNSKRRLGGILVSRTVHEAVAGRLKATFADLGNLALKNIERPIQAFSVKWEPSDWRRPSSPALEPSYEQRQPSSVEQLALPDKPSIAVLPFQNFQRRPRAGVLRRRHRRGHHHRAVALQVAVRDRPQFELCLQGSLTGHPTGRTRARCALRAGRERAKGRKHVRITSQLIDSDDWRPSLGRPIRRGTGEHLRAAGSGDRERRRRDRAPARAGGNRTCKAKANRQSRRVRSLFAWNDEPAPGHQGVHRRSAGPVQSRAAARPEFRVSPCDGGVVPLSGARSTAG